MPAERGGPDQYLCETGRVLSETGCTGPPGSILIARRAQHTSQFASPSPTVAPHRGYGEKPEIAVRRFWSIPGSETSPGFVRVEDDAVAHG